MAGRRVKKGAMKRGKKRGGPQVGRQGCVLGRHQGAREKGPASRDIKDAHPRIAMPGRALREYVQKIMACESVTMAAERGGAERRRAPA